MSVLSEDKVLNILIEAGWPPELLKKAFEIAFLESTFETGDKEDHRGRTSLGLFQITKAQEKAAKNVLGSDFSYDNDEDREKLLDPLTNAKVAYEAYRIRDEDWREAAIKEETWHMKEDDPETPDDESSPFAYNTDPWLVWTPHAAQKRIAANPDIINVGDEEAPASHYRGVFDNTQDAAEKWQKTKGPELVRGVMSEELVFSDPSSSLVSSKERLEGLQNFNLSDKGYSFRPKYPNQKDFDSYISDNTKTETQTALKPSMFPSRQEYESTVSKNTSNVLATGTDQTEDRFQPNFLKPDPKGGAMGAIENMRQ